MEPTHKGSQTYGELLYSIGVGLPRIEVDPKPIKISFIKNILNKFKL